MGRYDCDEVEKRAKERKRKDGRVKREGERVESNIAMNVVAEGMREINR